MKKKNILFVHDGENWIRGSERVLLDMIETLQSEGYVIKVCCNQSATVLVAELGRLGIDTIPLNLHSFLLYGGHNPFLFLKTCFEIYRIAKEFKAELIHASSGLAIQYCTPSATLLKIPSIAHIQGVYLRSARVMSLASHATVQLFVSKAISKPYEKHRDKQIILYNGIDSEKFFPSKETRHLYREGLGIKSSQIVVGFVGSFEHRKGISTLLRIAVTLKEVIPDIRFLLIGGGPLLSEYATERDTLGLKDNVYFVGERDDTAAMMNTFDLLVCPSTSEAFGLVAAEAASTGIPVVASNVGGLPEIVEHGRTGFLCSASNIDDFVFCCKQLIENPELRALQGERAREKILNDFSISAFRRNLIEIYSQTINKKHCDSEK